MKLGFVFALFLTCFALNIQAQEPTTEKMEGVVQERQKNQQDRIDQGVKSGELTEGEAKRLQKREKHIENMNEKAMSDGNMTEKEFKRIERAQNKASRKINRKKHNLRNN